MTQGEGRMEVRKRGGFSDRNGIKKENTLIQIYELEESSRIKMLNFIIKVMNRIYDGNGYWDDDFQAFSQYVFSEIYIERLNVRKYKMTEVLPLLEETFYFGTYDDVLTVFEAIVQYWEDYLSDNGDEIIGGSIYKIANGLLEREYIGYRFINGLLVGISNETEISSIEETLGNQYSVVGEHIAKALTLLSDRDNPDYENSIKESISGVESMCCILTNMKGKDATLGKAIKKLKDNGIKIHPALEEAYNKLYGYTSDAGGIRHSKGLGDLNATFAEAKYMLVACTAFINYLMDMMAD